jgi:archaellum component FlaG (FlaF/FlaG flagellin family)|tara:strand:- start:51 stop:275 length:225 start_codon:yes stop_codon:yes gene_type:complete
MKVLIAGLVSGLLSSSLFATTWTVDDDGKADFSNIQDAIDVASDGDEIVVADGQYFENITFSGKAVTVRSTPKK